MLDAKTYINPEVIKLAEENFISLKINAESETGEVLFNRFQGTGYPLIVFLDNKGNEIDRFYGYKPPYEFSIKMENILDGKNTFNYFLSEYEQGNYSSEILKPLADKYRDKGDDDAALALYYKSLETSNISKDNFTESKYYIASLSLNNDNTQLINQFLEDFESSKYFEKGIYDLIAYYKKNSQIENELEAYKKYILKLNNSANFLNSYAWRMSELNINLQDALKKIDQALLLVESSEPKYANILDTKAEVLWKMDNHDEAILIIDKAIYLDSESQYYKAQKEKFINSNN